MKVSSHDLELRVIMNMLTCIRNLVLRRPLRGAEDDYVLTVSKIGWLQVWITYTELAEREHQTQAVWLLRCK